MHGGFLKFIPKKNYLFFTLYAFLIIGFFCSLSLYYWDHFQTKNQANIQPQQFMKMFYYDIVKNLNQKNPEENITGYNIPREIGGVCENKMDGSGLDLTRGYEPLNQSWHTILPVLCNYAPLSANLDVGIYATKFSR